MYYEYQSINEIEQAAISGHLSIVNIESLNADKASLLTETTRIKAYENEIERWIELGIGGFNSTAQFQDKGSYDSSIECLERAEKRMTEAKDKGYDIDFSGYEEDIKQIFDYVKDDFSGSEALYRVVKDSEFVTDTYKSLLEESLPELGHKYTNKKLKKCKWAAKRLIRSWKTKNDMVSFLLDTLNDLEQLEQYNPEMSGKIEDIIQIAYEKGVESLLTYAIILKDNGIGKPINIIIKAEHNAEMLGRDITTEAQKIKDYIISS